MIERDLVELVERHREEQPMSTPPPDLLARARRERNRRRRRTTGITALVVLALGLVGAGVHAIGTLTSDPAPAADGGPPPWAVSPRPGVLDTTSSAPAERLVGRNGWAIRVPGGWGTDQVGCDGVTPLRPTVVLDHLRRRSGVCLVHTDGSVPSVRVEDRALRHGVPWRTVNGIAVQRALRPPDCHSCLTLGVPSAHVTFAIRARSASQLWRIATSLQPLSDRQITIPVPRPPDGHSPLDQLTRISLAEGLRPLTSEVPSHRPPGTFLRSNPPIGTPVDLGRGITLFYSAGDLGGVADAGSLRRHGWRVSPATTFVPNTGREAALRSLGRDPLATPAFLRNLTITHEGPRTVRVRDRPAWLVVTGSVRTGNSVEWSITAVDATSGRVLEARTGFVGRSS